MYTSQTLKKLYVNFVHSNIIKHVKYMFERKKYKLLNQFQIVFTL